MTRLVIATALFAVLGITGPARSADLYLEGLPPDYSPGSTLNFSAKLIGAEDLAAYQMDLVIQGSNVVNLFSFNIPDPSSEPDYVFAGASDGFFANVSFVSGNDDEVRLTFADSTNVPVTTSALSDLIANIQLTIAPEFSGPFFIFFDDAPGTLFLDDISGSSIPNINQIQIRPSPTSPAIIPVPEPSSLVVLTIALAGCIFGGERIKTFRSK